jgi:hypothetical protein
MSDMKFIDGLMFKPPVKKDGSPLPDFIKAKGSIKRQELIAWLQGGNSEWINFDLKESKGGKWYAAIDDWEPDSQKQEYNKGAAEAKKAMAPADDLDDDIPF